MTENSNSKKLEITSLYISYSNGSIAPNYRKTTTWVLTNESEEFRHLAAKVVAEAKVNKALSLAEFFKNPSAAPPREPISIQLRPSGGGSHHVTISFNNGQTLELTEDGAHELSAPYGSLFSLTKDKGQRSVRDDNMPMGLDLLVPPPSSKK